MITVLMTHVNKSCQNNYFFEKKGPIASILITWTIFSKYTKSTNKIQDYLVLWTGFNPLKFWQIVLSIFIIIFSVGPLTNQLVPNMSWR